MDYSKLSAVELLDLSQELQEKSYAKALDELASALSAVCPSARKIELYSNSYSDDEGSPKAEISFVSGNTLDLDRSLVAMTELSQIIDNKTLGIIHRKAVENLNAEEYDEVRVMVDDLSLGGKGLSTNIVPSYY